ncbi:hypothetical protein AL522_23175 [Pantoea vagans]|nr:hypothetical protein AL522_23175 [Pantoea vagans]
MAGLRAHLRNEVRNRADRAPRDWLERLSDLIVFPVQARADPLLPASSSAPFRGRTYFRLTATTPPLFQPVNRRFLVIYPQLATFTHRQ